jgi:hypothetical protein
MSSAIETSGAVNFAGSAETWIPSPTGWFKAIVVSAGSGRGKERAGIERRLAM